MWSPSRLRSAPYGRPFPFLTGVPASVDPVAGHGDQARDARPDAVASGPATDELITVEYSCRRAEIRPVVAAVRDTLGCGADPLDTPTRLEEALVTLIRSVGGSGEPRVRHTPAALLLPEHWHIRLHDTDERTLAILAEVVGRRPAR